MDVPSNAQALQVFSLSSAQELAVSPARNFPVQTRK